MERKVYEEIASACAARLNCIASKNAEWESRHEDKIIAMVKHYLPSGSGFDNGTKFDFDASTGEKLVFTTEFHHMDEMGGYAGWTEHRITLTPSFIGGFNMRISGRNRNDIKDYIGECFSNALGGVANVTSH